MTSRQQIREYLDASLLGKEILDGEIVDEETWGTSEEAQGALNRLANL